MSIYELSETIYKEAKEGFNAFLAEKGLKKVNVVKSRITLENKPLSLAIYPTATSGSTYKEDDENAEMYFTFDFYINKSATEVGINEGLEYYSALMDWLGHTTLGKASTIEQSIIIRMDEGEPVNGGVALVNVLMANETDLGWF